MSFPHSTFRYMSFIFSPFYCYMSFLHLRIDVFYFPHLYVVCHFFSFTAIRHFPPFTKTYHSLLHSQLYKQVLKRFLANITFRRFLQGNPSWPGQEHFNAPFAISFQHLFTISFQHSLSLSVLVSYLFLTL